MQYILLNSQRIDLSNDINYVPKRQFNEEESDQEMKNCIFSIYFLNQDIFHKNAPRHLKLGMPKDRGHIKGTMSQIFI